MGSAMVASLGKWRESTENLPASSGRTEGVMEVTVRIRIDNEAALEFNRQSEARTAGSVTFLDVLEDGIRRTAEQIDEFSHVEIRLG